jgi:fatty-acyl-CoA synthase
MSAGAAGWSAVTGGAAVVAPRTGARASSAAADWARALEATAPIARQRHRTWATVLDERAAALESAAALVSDDEALTYRALANRTNQYARWAIGRGLAKGDVVCLMMRNCPEYVAIWSGLTRVGVVVALLNTDLVGRSLARAIDAAAPNGLIVQAELAGRILAARGEMQSAPVIWSHGAGGDAWPRVDHEVDRCAADPLERAERRQVSIEDVALYIYTSGTTGPSKAARVSHGKVMQWTHWFAGLMNVDSSDRLYDCLPMYHSTGGVVAVGAALVGGGSVAVRDGFSARSFWRDVARWDCTLFQYVGELCRYLLQTPPDPAERSHRVRMCCGNGLRRDVWTQVQDRFGIPRILEFYASTEGTVSLFNVEGVPGSIGQVRTFVAHRAPVAVVKYDADTDAPIRDSRGRCIRCAPDEVGEAIGPLADRSAPAGAFEGYANEPASPRKVLHDAFQPGDAWFRTGDLMRCDARGHFYFADRVGDTFRWKGETVATADVAEAICAFPGVHDAAVYGVALPAVEGRAGMAAIVATSLDLHAFRAYLTRSLPDAARPVFLRVCGALQLTTTFKHVKAALARDGYDPAAVADPIYFNDRERDAFVRLDCRLWDRIRRGEVRV